jgi:hypothetical protein
MIDSNLKIGDRVMIRGSKYPFEITAIDGEYADSRRVSRGQLEGGPPFALFIADGGVQMGIRKLSSLAAFL